MNTEVGGEIRKWEGDEGRGSEASLESYRHICL